MKPLIILDAPFPYRRGGSEIKLANQLRQLEKKGHKAIVFAGKPEENAENYFPDLKSRIINIGPRYKSSDNFFFFGPFFYLFEHVYAFA